MRVSSHLHSLISKEKEVNLGRSNSNCNRGRRKDPFLCRNGLFSSRLDIVEHNRLFILIIMIFLCFVSSLLEFPNIDSILYMLQIFLNFVPYSSS